MKADLWDLIVKIEGPPGAVSRVDAAMTELVSFDIQKPSKRRIESVRHSDAGGGVPSPTPAVPSDLDQSF